MCVPPSSNDKEEDDMAELDMRSPPLTEDPVDVEYPFDEANGYPDTDDKVVVAL
jgi:hypothetical protein